MAPLRCDHKMHGELVDGLLEVKCGSRFCGASPETVVIHLFDVVSGKLIRTRRFQNPRSGRKN